MRVIGTAGHVDHGKSSLVQAVSGINPDRLMEEMAREMTIDLGFAWITLPDGEEVGIVDVPGHRDFIENMLSGIGGIDAALFVIAADEGVMPQTREHLAILDLLQIQGGVIALTKIDLVEDAEWLDLVEMDIHDAVQGTVLEGAPIVRVSSKTKEGLPSLMQALAECLAERPHRLDLGRPRLPVDRVFSISGFGTVVTGTLVDGRLNLGDEVVILPKGLKGRVRGLQSHKQKVESAVPGSRTAVNIAGVDLEAVERGSVICTPGKYSSSRRLDLFFRMLKDASKPLLHNSEVKLFLGASEVVARVRLLGLEQLEPGAEGWLQIETQEPVVAVRGDHYILRRPSPSETIGGGVVIDPHPEKRHKRFSEDVLKNLEALRAGSPEDVLYQAALGVEAAAVRDLTAKSRLAAEQADPALANLLEEGRLILLDSSPLRSASDQLVTAQPHWQRLSEAAHAAAAAYHQTYPLRRGIPKEELKSRLKVEARLFAALLRRWLEEGSLMQTGTLIYLPDHQIQFSAGLQARVDQLLQDFASDPYKTPSVKDCAARIGEEGLNALLDLGVLVQTGPEVLFRKQDYDALCKALDETIGLGRLFTVGEFRDLIQTSRKYALAFLEHLDSQGITLREGDGRKLRKPAQQG